MLINKYFDSNNGLKLFFYYCLSFVSVWITPANIWIISWICESMQIGILLLLVSVNECIISYLHTNPTTNVNLMWKLLLFEMKNRYFHENDMTNGNCECNEYGVRNHVCLGERCDAHYEPCKICEQCIKEFEWAHGREHLCFSVNHYYYVCCMLCVKWSSFCRLLFDWRFSTLIIVLTLYLTSGYSHSWQTIRGREIEKNFMW